MFTSYQRIRQYRFLRVLILLLQLNGAAIFFGVTGMSFYLWLTRDTHTSRQIAKSLQKRVVGEKQGEGAIPAATPRQRGYASIFFDRKTIGFTLILASAGVALLHFALAELLSLFRNQAINSDVTNNLLREALMQQTRAPAPPPGGFVHFPKPIPPDATIEEY